MCLCLNCAHGPHCSLHSMGISFTPSMCTLDITYDAYTHPEQIHTENTPCLPRWARGVMFGYICWSQYHSPHMENGPYKCRWSRNLGQCRAHLQCLGGSWDPAQTPVHVGPVSVELTCHSSASECVLGAGIQGPQGVWPPSQYSR